MRFCVSVFCLFMATMASAQEPVRFARERFQAMPKERPPLAVAYSPEWATTVPVEKAGENGEITLNKGEKPPLIDFQLPVNAAEYNVLRVTMRVTGGARCQLVWQGDVETEPAKLPGIKLPLLPGDDYHEYAFLLDSVSPECWMGAMTRFRLTLSNEPADVAIRAMTFEYAAPSVPMRVELANVSLEALLGTQEPFKMTPPEGAVFEVYAGMAARAWKAYQSDGARFQCLVSEAGGTETAAAELTLTPAANEAHRQWTPMTVDLAPYAGKEIAIRLAVDGLESGAGDFACWGAPAMYVAGGPGKATPVVLISCDTMRADHLGCYGYARPTSPVIDAFAADAVLYEHAIVQDSWTLPSHMSMLTGLYPKTHNVSQRSNLAAQHRTLAEWLSARGYVTAGFTSITWWLESWRGFGRGFDVYSAPSPYRPIQQTNATAFAWLDGHAAEKLFLFLHNYDLHGKSQALGQTLPYTPDDPQFLQFSKAFNPPPALIPEGSKTVATEFLMDVNGQKAALTDVQREYVVALYDDCYLQVDAGIEELFADLKKRGLYERALIILTADHGESFGEHGAYLHEEAYETCSHVPLIIRYPGGRYAGTRVADVVQGVDLFATIADVLGMPLDIQTDGQSLLALLEKRAEPRQYAYTRRHNVEAVRSQAWKHMRTQDRKREEFYDMANDPGEMKNRATENLPELPPFQQESDTFYARDPGGWHLRIVSGEQPLELDITLTTADEFESADFVQFTRSKGFSISNGGKQLSGMFKLGPKQARELVIKMLNPAAEATATFKSVQPFTACPGAGAAESTTVWTLRLTPNEKGLATAPDMANAAKPAVAAWHVPQKSKGGAAKEMSEQDKDELKALGYLN